MLSTKTEPYQLKISCHSLRSFKLLTTSLKRCQLYTMGVFLWGDLDQDQWSKVTQIMMHQRNKLIHSVHGFTVSFKHHVPSDLGSLILILTIPKKCTLRWSLPPSSTYMHIHVFYVHLYNNQINVCAPSVQSAVGYSAGKPRKNRMSSELLYQSNRPQVSMGYRLINHLGCL